jgi:poly(A) polymerase
MQSQLNPSSTSSEFQGTNKLNKIRKKQKKTSSLMESSSSCCSGSTVSTSSSHDSSSVSPNTLPTMTIATLAPKTPLQKALVKVGCYDLDDSHRQAVVSYIENTLCRWAQSLESSLTTNNKEDQDVVESPNVALIPFGSYRLGVHRVDSDIDLLALAPPSCTRQEFFSSFVRMLANDPEVSQLHPISTAYTPVIKFVVKSIQIDLVFCRVASSKKLIEYQKKMRELKLDLHDDKIPLSFPSSVYIIDDSDLLGLDEAGVRSLNGARVAQILLAQVEPFCSLDVYRTVLRAVKQWAIKAGVYSNVLGFLGGINWAILVAFVCRTYRGKYKTPSVILRAFFRTFAEWKWPTPVLLVPLQNVPPTGDVPLLPGWNPVTNPRDYRHLMPIITPAYPSMNSSYNVGIPQRRRIQDEMRRACNSLTQQPNDYDSLLVNESDFFTRHTHFVQINIRAKNRQDFVEWFRLVESRLRLLIVNLDTDLVQALPFARFFERKYNSQGVCVGTVKEGDVTDENCLHERSFFIALRFVQGLDQINLCHYTSDFLYKVNTWEGRRLGMDLSIAHVTENNLPPFLLAELGMKQDDDVKNANTENTANREGGNEEELNSECDKNDALECNGLSFHSRTDANVEMLTDSPASNIGLGLVVQ